MTNRIRGVLASAGLAAVVAGVSLPAAAADVVEEAEVLVRPRAERRVVVEEERDVVTRPRLQRRTIIEEEYAQRPRAERQIVEEREVVARPSAERRVVVEEHRLAPRERIGFVGRPIPPRPVLAAGEVYGRPVYDDGDECRIIVKRRLDAWGDVVVRRVRVCD